MKISKYQKQFGVGPVGLLVSLFVLALLWLLDRNLGHVVVLNKPQPIRILGFILIGLWICWHVWAIRTIKLWWNNDRLCTAGPFRFMRHPMYAGGMFLADFGIALLLNSWIILPWPILLYPIMSVLVRKEEKMMAEVFGEEYEKYAAKTGRFIPRFRREAGPYLHC